jgi:anti-anti-sigma regulatory factor
MNKSSPNLLVSVLGRVVCVKIIGRANFNSSIDFKTLIHELRQRGYACFLIDLSECQILDSTFLGVLAGLGLGFADSKGKGNQGARAGVIQLLNPNQRVTELLENLGVGDLFQLVTGDTPNVQDFEPVAAAARHASKAEVTRNCLEAHELLMSLKEENVARFKDVARFLAEDLKKLEEAGSKH